MARDGEILNSDRLQAMSDDLDIGGRTRYPKQLNTDDVKVVYDISNGGAAQQGKILTFGMAGGSLAGQEAVTLPLVGPGTVDGGGDVILPSSTTQAYRIDAIAFRIDFDEAGAEAFSGKYMGLYLAYGRGAGDPPEVEPVYWLNPWCRVAGDSLSGLLKTRYVWCLGGASQGPGSDITGPLPLNPAIPPVTWAGVVPALPGTVGLELNLHVRTLDGTSWPSNTEYVYTLYGRKSQNAVPPASWQ